MFTIALLVLFAATLQSWSLVQYGTVNNPRSGQGSQDAAEQGRPPNYLSSSSSAAAATTTAAGAMHTLWAAQQSLCTLTEHLLTRIIPLSCYQCTSTLHVLVLVPTFVLVYLVHSLLLSYLQDGCFSRAVFT